MPTKRIQSLKGSLILDGGRLVGSYFHRTVVLVCQHDASGAFGLVLNRPDEKPLGEVIAAELPERLNEAILFLGGPVQPTALSFLVSSPALLSANVMDQLRLSHDLDELIEAGRSWAPGQQLRVFAGYAGWAPGQLDDEMQRDSWLTHPASLDLVFGIEPAQLWRHILRGRPRWEERLLADSPEDLGSN